MNRHLFIPAPAPNHLTSSRIRVSTVTTPTGMPPILARPHTVVVAHPESVSVKESRSNNPLRYFPDDGSIPPSMSIRGSYGRSEGINETERNGESQVGEKEGDAPTQGGI